MIESGYTITDKIIRVQRDFNKTLDMGCSTLKNLSIVIFNDGKDLCKYSIFNKTIILTKHLHTLTQWVIVSIIQFF